MSDNIQSWQENENEHIHTMENEEQPSEETVVNPEGQATFRNRSGRWRIKKKKRETMEDFFSCSRRPGEH